MNEKTEQLIRELAEKIGTTANHLWEVLNHQLYVEVMQGAVFAVIFTVIAVAMSKFAAKKFKEKPVFDQKGNPVLDWNDFPRKKADWDGDNGWAVIFVAINAIVAIVALTSTIDFVQLAIQAIFNPEYWALKQILK